MTKFKLPEECKEAADDLRGKIEIAGLTPKNVPVDVIRQLKDSRDALQKLLEVHVGFEKSLGCFDGLFAEATRIIDSNANGHPAEAGKPRKSTHTYPKRGDDGGYVG